MIRRNPIRSLTARLTLAFVLVALAGSIGLAAAIQIQAQQRFNQFILSSYQADRAVELAAYYEENGSWEGVNILYYSPYTAASNVPEASPDIPPGIPSDDAPDTRPADGNANTHRVEPLLVVDQSKTVVLGPPDMLGQQIDFKPRWAIPVESDGKDVGWVVLNTTDRQFQPGSPERIFLDSFKQGVIISGLIGVIIALPVGVLLARNITLPLRQLTAATRKVAGGELGYQVTVSSQDELGQLADSFNQMSADLAHSNDLRRQMTADVAHDLRTPLSVILGYTEALSDGKLGGTPEVFNVMHDEAQHLQRLIDDLRTLSLADAGELPLMKLEINPANLLERVAVAHRPLAQEKEVAIETDLPPALPSVEVDPDRLAQVLSNLIGNALRYTPSGGHIRLSAAQDDGKITVRVADDGQGIDPADLPYIFERFYRGDRARAADQGESGLGLAIARSIVVAHGGQIAVASQPGSGTTFTITLPVLGGVGQSS